MNIDSCLYSCEVGHYRHTPKKYSFKNSFFWFGLKSSELNSNVIRKVPLIGIEEFAPYKYSHHDHLDYKKGSLLENAQHFLNENGVTKKIDDLTICTNLSFLGHVFNPINLILIQLDDGKRCAIIEIGNTFGEIKPYLVPESSFEGCNFTHTVQKFFYISPFIDHRNFMTFNYKESEEDFSLSIVDFEKQEDDSKKIILTTEMKAIKQPLTTRNILFQTIKNPFNTLYVIFFIHFHAFFLWMKKIKYYKKNEYSEYQKGP